MKNDLSVGMASSLSSLFTPEPIRMRRGNWSLNKCSKLSL